MIYRQLNPPLPSGARRKEESTPYLPNKAKKSFDFSK
jgi:hypothetical protein